MTELKWKNTNQLPVAKFGTLKVDIQHQFYGFCSQELDRSHIRVSLCSVWFTSTAVGYRTTQHGKSSDVVRNYNKNRSLSQLFCSWSCFSVCLVLSHYTCDNANTEVLLFGVCIPNPMHMKIRPIPPLRSGFPWSCEHITSSSVDCCTAITQATPPPAGRQEKMLHLPPTQHVVLVGTLSLSLSSRTYWTCFTYWRHNTWSCEIWLLKISLPLQSSCWSAVRC